MAQNISVPDIGDFKDVEVIEVLVKPGDKVNKNDPIVTIESDKSSLEIPSPSSGEIKDLKVKIGDKVSEGSILATIENGKIPSTPKVKKIESEQVKEKPIANGNITSVKHVKKVFAEPASKDDIDPVEIPDDVVRLIAYNKEAFADFASIKNQEDVTSFNQKYNVSMNIDVSTV